MRLYLDTSVIGALFDVEMPERIRITHELLDLIVEGKHVGVISNIVLEEIDQGPEELKEKLVNEIRKVPFQVIVEDENSADLLEIYEQENFIRRGARLDLRHLSVATAFGVDAFHGIFGIS